MSKTYTISLERVSEYDLVVHYSDNLKTASPEELSVALEDCINTLKNHLLLLQET